MQTIKNKAPGAWASTKTGSKKGFDKAWKALDKLGAPVNRLSNRLGSEAFWPTTLDKESDKAARILRSFCKDGFYTEVPIEETPDAQGQLNEDGTKKEAYTPSQEGVPQGKQRVIKKIPQKVIENAVGLAIFTTMRTGLWLSGAGGSGILVARKEDGSWSPPSGILLHTAGLGFLVGVDIYDCVLVINNRKALESFTHVRATLGGEISATAGPVGMGGVLENDGKWKEANRPVFTYLKSRGFYAGVQVDGTIIIERSDENARFYNHSGIRATEIFAGIVKHPPLEIKTLMETLKSAEGRTDVDQALVEELDDIPAPADLELESPNKNAIFGIPPADDPDPYGVHALEAEGLDIHEAKTGKRPSHEAFTYNPKPSSPVFGIRSSLDIEKRGRGDSVNSRSDIGTQTDEGLGLGVGVKKSHRDHDAARSEELYTVESRSTLFDRSYSSDAQAIGAERLPESADGEVPGSWPDLEKKFEQQDLHSMRGKVPPPPLPPRQVSGFEEVDLGPSLPKVM